MKTIFTYLSLLTAFFLLTKCKQETTHQISGYYPSIGRTVFANLNSKLGKLADTSNMNPAVMSDIVTYRTIKVGNKSYIDKQNIFILTSGFPLVNRNYTTNNQMPSDFASADILYKKFISANSNNPFLNVFKQNTASLITRKYLLQNQGMKKELQFYTEELLQSHSQNYPLIYLAIIQLKGFVPGKRLIQYKTLIHTDPYLIQWNKRSDLIITDLTSKESQVKGDTLKTLQMVIALQKLAKVKSSYFVRKIDKI